MHHYINIRVKLGRGLVINNEEWLTNYSMNLTIILYCWLYIKGEGHGTLISLMLIFSTNGWLR